MHRPRTKPPRKSRWRAWLGHPRFGAPLRGFDEPTVDGNGGYAGFRDERGGHSEVLGDVF